MSPSKFEIGAQVFVNHPPNFVGKVLSIRLNMEDESYKYVVGKGDHIETVDERYLTSVEDLPFKDFVLRDEGLFE